MKSLLPRLQLVELMDLRSYTPEEMLDLAGAGSDPGFSWRSGTLGGWLVPVIYIEGIPTPASVTDGIGAP